MLIAFDGITRPVEFVNCDDILPHLKSVLFGWHFDEVPAGGAEPVIRVRREGRHYRVASPWYDEPLRESTAVSALCTLLVDVVWAWIEEVPSFFCLHCGAAEFAGRLAVFPSSYRAGKSTLVARLAAAGVRIHSDDVLPIDAVDEAAVAPGVAPRLRLPLPPRATDEFRSFVASHAGPDDGYYRYLDLPASLHARHGERAPVGAFVLLERSDSGPARLLPARKSDSLRQVIRQNFGRREEPAEIVASLHRLVDRTPCFTLGYSDLEEAAGLLQQTFRTWPPAVDEAPAAPAVYPSAPAPAAPASAPAQPRARGRVRAQARKGRYRRSEAVSLQGVDDEVFLIDARNPCIFHLNAVGASLWNLMSEPVSLTDAVEIFESAFPEQPWGVIARDLAMLFEDLAAAGLIVRVEE